MDDGDNGAVVLGQLADGGHHVVRSGGIQACVGRGGREGGGSGGGESVRHNHQGSVSIGTPLADPTPLLAT